MDVKVLDYLINIFFYNKGSVIIDRNDILMISYIHIKNIITVIKCGQIIFK